MKSADVVAVIVKRAQVLVHERFDDPVCIAAAASPKKWKRTAKCHLRKFSIDQTGFPYDPTKPFADWGWETIDVLDPTPITDDCIVRWFVNDVLEDGLDPTVITDPTDTKILVIGWHCD